MKVTGVRFLGIRTEHFEATTRFFGEVMGLDITRQEPGTRFRAMPQT